MRTGRRVVGYVKRYGEWFVNVVGGSVITIVGIIAIPFVGPGVLIVFVGLGLLAREFAFAQRWLDATKRGYESWRAFVKRQNWFVKSSIRLVVVAVTLAMLWLFGVFGFFNHLLGLNWNWMVSPLK